LGRGTYAQSRAEVDESESAERFGEDIGKHVVASDVFHFHGLAFEVFMQVVVSDVGVLSSKCGSSVLGHLNVRLIVYVLWRGE